jgi:site-specific DNA-cytosine methylase
MAKGKPKALGVFIFAGGFTVGVQKHFDIIGHFEDGPYGVATAQHNLKNYRGEQLPVWEDTSHWPVGDITRRDRPDFIYGNPPCAPWSLASAGRSVHWTDDPRLNYVRRQFALLDQMKPTVWAWESVRPAYTRGRAFVDTIVEAAMARGYSATALLVNGEFHGVPQTRKRFFLVLHRVAIPWAADRNKKIPTVADAFARPFKRETLWPSPCPPMELKLLKKARPGEGLSLAFNRLFPEKVEARGEGERLKGRPSFQRMRLRADRPSPVLLGIPHKYHPDKDRLISVEESAALCGYPRGFEFQGPIAKRFAQVAQAVMPPVGEYLARMVRAGIDGGLKIKEPFYREVHVYQHNVVSTPLTLGETPRMSLEIAPPETGRVFDRPTGDTIVINARGARTKSVIVRAPRQGIGFYIRTLLTQGNDVPYILNAVKKKFPTSKAQKSDVYWNKRKLEQQGGRP